MSIEAGQPVPSASVLHVRREDFREVDPRELFAGRRVALVTLIGAFTDTCSERHLPGYLQKVGQIKAKGVDVVACLAVNDRFVMQAWIAEHDIGDEFVMLADGDGSFTRALGLDIEIPHMGLRCARGLLLVDDGRIESVHIEKPLALDVSTADACLALL